MLCCTAASYRDPVRNKNHGLRHLVLVSAVQIPSSFCRLCSYGLLSLASSDSSLNDDLKGLAPKRCKYLKKLPEIY